MTENSTHVFEEGAELSEEEMTSLPDEPSSESEPAEVEHDEVRDGA